MPRRSKKTLLNDAKKAVAELEKRVTSESSMPSGQLRPGTALPGLGGKVPWTMQALAESYNHEMVTFVPMATVPVTINGVRVQFIEGLQVTCLKPFKDRYDNFMGSQREAIHSAAARGLNPQVGVGGLP